SVRPGHPAPAATLPAIPAAAPSGAQDYRWFVRDPLGLTPPGYELAPHTGLTRLLHEREMKADSMPERLLIGPGSPPSLDPVYPELSPPLEPFLSLPDVPPSVCYPSGRHRQRRRPKSGGQRNLDPRIGREHASRHGDCQHHGGREPAVRDRSTQVKC